MHDTKDADSSRYSSEVEQFSRTIFTKPLAVPWYLSSGREQSPRQPPSHAPESHTQTSGRVADDNTLKSKGLGVEIVAALCHNLWLYFFCTATRSLGSITAVACSPVLN